MKTLTVDDQQRIRLPSARPRSRFAVENREDGSILLVPVKAKAAERFPKGSLTRYFADPAYNRECLEDLERLRAAGMKQQFDVWRFNFPVKGEHPVVLISPPDRCSVSQTVNVLLCTSQRQSRAIKGYEVMLDTADGLDWETFCDCSILWSVPSAGLFGKRGHVTVERRRAIRGIVRDLFRLLASD